MCNFEFFSGHGVFVEQDFEAGDFLLEYRGKRLSGISARKLEDERSKKQRVKYPRIYTFFYRFNEKEWW